MSSKKSDLISDSLDIVIDIATNNHDNVTIDPLNSNHNPQTGEDPRYIKISVSILKRVFGLLPFDIYIQRANKHHTKIFSKDSSIDKELIDKYVKKGIRYFYINNELKETYNFYVEKLLEKSLSGETTLSPKALRNIINEMVNISLSELQNNTELDDNLLAFAKSAIKGCTQILESDFEGLCKIMQALSSRTYQSKHAFLTGILSILLAKALGNEGQKTLLSVGLGGLLHDIGMKRISSCLIEKPDLSSEEWHDIKQHTVIGHRMASDIRGIGPAVRTIILQHHEQPNGMGYPNRLTNNEIFPLAKIVAIGDVFSALICRPPHRKLNYTTQEALQIMMEDRGRFDKNYLNVFIKMIMPKLLETEIEFTVKEE